LAQIARTVIAIIRAVLVGRVCGFDSEWERRQYGIGEHSAISKCAHAPQSHQSHHGDHYDEMMPPARAWELIVIIIGPVSFASLGCLDIIIFAVIGRGEQQSRSLETRQKPIIDHFGRAKPA
jgi:hypothetical protein